MKDIFNGRLIEAFEGLDQRVSMQRYTLYGSFLIASMIMLWETVQGRMTQELFNAYIFCFAGVHVLGKGIDAYKDVRNTETQASTITPSPASPATPPIEPKPA